MRKMFLCMLAAGALAATAPAFASDKDNSEDRGGIDIGPLGQCFDPGACGYSRGGYSYGYAFGLAPSERVRQYRHPRHFR